MKVTINQLRCLSILEGLSYLLLVGIGMPLKYWLGMPLINLGLGMCHGLLTIVFFGFLMAVWIQKTLPFKWCLAVLALSLIPFGAFWADKQLIGFQQSHAITTP